MDIFRILQAINEDLAPSWGAQSQRHDLDSLGSQPRKHPAGNGDRGDLPDVLNSLVLRRDAE